MTVVREHYQLKETIVTIIAEDKKYIEVAKKEIQKCRNEIEQYIRKDEFFKVTLKPYIHSKKDPEIIKKMCNSANKVIVGPMATVAGIIAEYAVKAMVSRGAKYAIVDNGGDIALYSNRLVNIGIYTGKQKTAGLALQILPSNDIIGICTSSGNIGYSLSFGNADSVTVFSNNLSVADAAATALGNLVNSGCDIESAFKILEGIQEISGAIIIIGKKIGFWGNVPKIVPANVSYDLITRGRYN